jgi:NADH:ubiquinone oxidoreductase subunit 6 (subunit J)
MTGTELLFWMFALAACGGAIAVVASQNVVRMAFWLIISLGSVAGLFFLLRADFVAATQLLIYVGGTVVLLVFGVMLTASGPYLRIQSSPGESIAGAVVGALFLAMILLTVHRVNWGRTATLSGAEAGVATANTGQGYNEEAAGNTARPIGLALLGLRPDKDLGAPAGGPLSTGYLLVFEIASIHLLVVLIGAAYLARAKRRVDARDSESKAT